jgi:hypothetical protein
LAPGQTQTVRVTLDPQLLCVFNVAKDGWELISGEYKVFVGGSSRHTPLVGQLQLPPATKSAGAG